MFFPDDTLHLPSDLRHTVHHVHESMQVVTSLIFVFGFDLIEYVIFGSFDLNPHLRLRKFYWYNKYHHRYFWFYAESAQEITLL